MLIIVSTQLLFSNSLMIIISIIPVHNATKIGKRHRSVMTRSMEYYGQNFGFILYHHDLKGPYEASKLFIDGLADRAYVYVNGQLRGMVYRTDKKKFVSSRSPPNRPPSAPPSAEGGTRPRNTRWNGQWPG